MDYKSTKEYSVVRVVRRLFLTYATNSQFEERLVHIRAKVRSKGCHTARPSHWQSTLDSLESADSFLCKYKKNYLQPNLTVLPSVIFRVQERSHQHYTGKVFLSCDGRAQRSSQDSPRLLLRGKRPEAGKAIKYLSLSPEQSVKYC